VDGLDAESSGTMVHRRIPMTHAHESDCPSSLPPPGCSPFPGVMSQAEDDRCVMKSFEAKNWLTRRASVTMRTLSKNTALCASWRSRSKDLDDKKIISIDKHKINRNNLSVQYSTSMIDESASLQSLPTDEIREVEQTFSENFSRIFSSHVRILF
jgi:hypothetical protein